MYRMLLKKKKDIVKTTLIKSNAKIEPKFRNYISPYYLSKDVGGDEICLINNG